MFNIEQDIKEMMDDAIHDQRNHIEEALPTDKSIDLLKKIMDIANEAVIRSVFPHGDGSTKD